SLALYDFSPENDNELELREGQIIQVGYRHGQGWLVAMNLETGEQGLVPEEYVRLLR
ncbi:SH3 domain-containing protein, partial [Elsinoe ampelina]